jgi:uncharacterized protein (UPF0548 family)
MWFARRPSPRVLDGLLASLAARPLSYPEVGMSREGRAVPPHYGREEHEVESDGRFAYGYGTLEGHSEHGEEMFAVERVASGRVRAVTIAHARPQDVLARLGQPIAHRVQRRIKVDYMQALLRGSK